MSPIDRVRKFLFLIDVYPVSHQLSVAMTLYISFTEKNNIQYIPRNMHMVFALLCFVVVIHWLISPYPSGLLHWHCGNLTIAPVPAKQPWWIWINTSCEFIMNDCKTTTKQSTTKQCAYFLGYTVASYEIFHNIVFRNWRYLIEMTVDNRRLHHVSIVLASILKVEDTI